MSIYRRAGIDDVEAFYAGKFSDNTAHLVLENHRNAYDVKFAKHLWFYEQITPGSRVLDFGCGGGGLAVLKRKGCHLTGVDLSASGVEKAVASGYDEGHVGWLSELPLAPHSFDFIVSCDVFGHIEAPDKDQVIRELKGFLRPGGVMLHGIEAGDIDYDGMTPEALAAFVSVDGHVGYEGGDAILARWRGHFDHVEGAVRFAHAKGRDDLLKEALEYGHGELGDVARWMASFGEREHNAFDLAMGLVFRSLERHKAPAGCQGGFMLLRVSDEALPSWRFQAGYELPRVEQLGVLPLDATVCEGVGWGGVEAWPMDDGPPVRFRWAGPRVNLNFRVPASAATARFVVRAPDQTAPARWIVRDSLANEILVVAELGADWSEVRLPIRPDTSGALMLELLVDRSWSPSWTGGSDDRVLGFALREIELRGSGSS